MTLTEFRKTSAGITAIDAFTGKSRMITSAEIEAIRSTLPGFLADQSETRCFLKPCQLPQNVFSFNNPHYQSSFNQW